MLYPKGRHTYERIGTKDRKAYEYFFSLPKRKKNILGATNARRRAGRVGAEGQLEGWMCLNSIL